MQHYLVGTAWEHFFQTEVKDTVRFVFDTKSGQIIYAERANGVNEWAALTSIQQEDLEDSLKNANEEALTTPEDWGLVSQSFLPFWVPNSVDGLRCNIPVVVDKAASNFSFMVERLNTNNWNPCQSYVSLAAAMQKAEELKKDYPHLGVQIRHYQGGPIVIHSEPVWKFRSEPSEKPYDVALWTGTTTPPSVGSKVSVRLNNLGAGTVTGYAVEEGYLGVMVKLDDEHRPSWHKENNPENKSSLVFGVELR